MSFSEDIKDFSDKVNKAAVNTFRGTALSLFSKVVIRTPVDTGRLRGNWFSSINISPKGKGSEGYEGTVSRAKLGDSIYLTNNLPYADAVENGSSDQAPHGMVKVTVNEFKDEVKRQAAKNKV